MNFKIIGIRPLPDCNPKFLKNLKVNDIYQFYANYIFSYKDGNQADEVTGVTLADNPLNDLYNVGNLKVSVSAVVGKNGSGKSSVMELLICAINNISFSYGFKLNNQIVGSRFGLEEIKEVKVEFYYEYDGIYKVVIDKGIQFYKLNDKKLFKVSSKDFKYHIKNNFFYTQVINYSLHSYNSLEIGQWIYRLFHKNDGYQIPIVLNPYREQTGSININREKELAEDRLLATLLIPATQYSSSRKLTDVLFATKLKLTLKKFEEYDKREIYGILENGQLKERVYMHQFSDRSAKQAKYITDFFLPKGYFESTDKHIKLVKFYLLVKVIKIANIYPDFDDVFDKKNRAFYQDKLRPFLIDLRKDSSHITYKIKRLLNFIEHKDKLGIDFGTKVLGINTYANNVTKISTNIIDFLPPPIFDTEIILQIENESKKEIYFGDLSSGEKQLIYSINTLVYHINNLDSVIQRRSKIKYRAINIILDEIELYFHPEYQRQFIKRIIESFGRLNLNHISAINICCVTHSPFILSDIPSANIMFLAVDDINKSALQIIDKNQTFAANIHELLSDGFFMEYTKGAFSLSKINEILQFYLEAKEVKEGDQGFDSLKANYKSKRLGFVSIIGVIGEEYIKKILQNHMLYLEEKFKLNFYLQDKRHQLQIELDAINKLIEE